MKLPLTRQQRKALFAGEHPRIVWRRVSGEAHPTLVKLSSKVSFLVSGIEATDDPQEWNLLYVVKDDRPRLLRARTRSAGYGEGLRDDLTGAELVKASEASAYTHSPGAALRGSGEEVSRADQERFKKEASDPALALLRTHRADVKATLDRIRDNPLLHGSGTVSRRLQSGEIQIERALRTLESRINETARRTAA